MAEHSFLVPIRYSLLFSNHWQLGSQNWQDTSSDKKDYFDTFYWTRYCYHGNTAGSKPALNNGLDLFSLLDFFHHLSLENPEKYWPIDTGLAF